MKNRHKLQPKIDAIIEIIKSIDLEEVTEERSTGTFSWHVQISGETDGSIQNKILVARKMLREVAKIIDGTKVLK